MNGVRLDDYPIEKIKLNYEMWLTKDYTFEQNIVACIESPTSSKLLTSREEYLKARDAGKVIKIERIEQMNEDGRFLASSVNELYGRPHLTPTVHLFISPIGSASFMMHTDPDDVFIICLKGQKTFLIEDELFVDLKPGQGIFIPANVRHQGLNYEASVTASVGLETYLEFKM